MGDLKTVKSHFSYIEIHNFVFQSLTHSHIYTSLSNHHLVFSMQSSLPPCRKCALQGVPMVDALRAFLESFRLPGESPIVERILEVFSQHWLVRVVGCEGCRV